MKVQDSCPKVIYKYHFFCLTIQLCCLPENLNEFFFLINQILEIVDAI